MDKSKSRDHLIRQRIAANIAHYRKLHNMTQSELAVKINYSDKSVSKWERGDGVPDIYVLITLAELFNVSVNDLVSENAPLPPPPDPDVEKKRVFILLMSVLLAWLSATVAYTVLRVVVPDFAQAWLCFIVALVVTFILCTVFSSLWWGLLPRLLSVSALIWSIAAGIYVIFPLVNMRLIFVVGGVMQLLGILWFTFQGRFRRIEIGLIRGIRRRKH
jgi:transcriptional regulator with XRE-family HTH domain